MAMQALYTQVDRPLAVTTALGADTLLLERFRGSEGISTLFHFTLDLLAEAGTDIPFERILGAPLSVRITDASGKPRFFHGICSRFREGPPVPGPKGPGTFTRYQAEMVPQFWLSTRKVQSRIFQHMTVVDILKTVLKGLDFTIARLHGDFQARNYCTQYRESDFAFACRLMEEEGIAFHFEHEEKKHTLVLTNDNAGFPQLPEDRRTLELRLGELAPKAGSFIHAWEKAQEICAGKFTLRDHCFELPHSDLEERLLLRDTIAVGTVKHALKCATNEELEVYDYPAGHATYFDEIDASGAAHPDELDKVRQDAARRVKLRMEQEASQSMRIEAASNSAHGQPGFKLNVVRRHESVGTYLLTQVAHEARLSGSYLGNGEGDFKYENRFECLPDDLKYRPPLRTPRPRIQGTQTAVVVGLEPGGIYTDKYGRVKVQFHWDRDGKKDISSSCWIRVLQPWAGQGWGSVNLPRAGQEVVVDFLEGDPDRPLILGSVYNAEQMPPYSLPEQAQVSGIKSRSLLSKNPEHFNEIRLDDTAGSEKFVIQAQKDLAGTVENDYTLNVSNDSTITIGGNQTETVDGNQTTTIGNTPATMNFLITWNNIEINKLTKSVVSSVSHADTSALNLNIYGIQFTGVGILNAEVDLVKYEKVLTKKWESCGAKSLNTTLNSTETVGRNQIVSVKNDKTETVGRNYRVTAGRDLELKGRDVTIRTKSNDPSSEMLSISSKNEVNVGATNCVNVSCGEEGGDIVGLFLQKKGSEVHLLGSKITFEASDQIILRAPKVVIQGQSDQVIYHAEAYQLVDEMKGYDARDDEISDILDEKNYDPLVLAAIKAFYGLP